MEISLQDVAGGALQEKMNQAFAQVMQNMQDPNTPWKNKRKINICLSFEQDEDRTDCTCDIAVDVKLAGVKPVSTKFCTEKDLDTGQIYAREYGSGIRGQMSFGDMDSDADNLVEIGGRIADGQAGETRGDHVVDFRARQA